MSERREWMRFWRTLEPAPGPAPQSSDDLQLGRSSDGDPGKGLELLKIVLDQLSKDVTTSREMQQRSVSWLGTTISALLFGTLVYVANAKDWDHRVVLLTLGVAAPVAAMCASVIFLGELIRQGRAAVIGRSLERWAAGEPSLHVGTIAPISPLFVETTYARLGGRRRGEGYGVATYYLSMLTLFGSSMILGPVVASLLTWDVAGARVAPIDAAPLSLYTGSLATIVWAAVTLAQALRVARMSKRTVPLGNQMS